MLDPRRFSEKIRSEAHYAYQSRKSFCRQAKPSDNGKNRLSLRCSHGRFDKIILDMDEQVLEKNPALPPHKYPLWVKLLGVGIVITTLYSLILLPEYLVAAKKMRAAEAAYQRGDYQSSLELYRSVLGKVPTSKTARIGEALAIFSDGDTSDDEVGLTLLQGITLDKENWARITRVMPVEYQQYFGNVKQ